VVQGGRLFAVQACTPEHKATLAKVAANPAEEAKADRADEHEESSVWRLVLDGRTAMRKLSGELLALTEARQSSA
jgi:hypothetical protein